MKLLLDTCAFIWLAIDSNQLSAAARSVFLDPKNEIFLSAVTAWEMSVNYGLGRLRSPEAPATFIPKYCQGNGILPLPMDQDSALLEAKLPVLHSDPFDRMLICQAMAHGMTLLTCDPEIHKDPVLVLW